MCVCFFCSVVSICATVQPFILVVKFSHIFISLRSFFVAFKSCFRSFFHPLNLVWNVFDGVCVRSKYRLTAYKSSGMSWFAGYTFAFRKCGESEQNNLENKAKRWNWFDSATMSSIHFWVWCVCARILIRWIVFSSLLMVTHCSRHIIQFYRSDNPSVLSESLVNDQKTVYPILIHIWTPNGYSSKSIFKSVIPYSIQKSEKKPPAHSIKRYQSVLTRKIGVHYATGFCLFDDPNFFDFILKPWLWWLLLQSIISFIFIPWIHTYESPQWEVATLEQTNGAAGKHRMAREWKNGVKKKRQMNTHTRTHTLMCTA